MHISVFGIACAVAACALWALCFVAPIVLETFSPLAIALGRYIAFGLISLCLVPIAWQSLGRLSRADWKTALALSLVGNVGYYILLVAAIQLIDVPGPTVVIGLLPLTISIVGNYKTREMNWRGLRLPLITLALGLIVVHAYEYRRLALEQHGMAYIPGLGLAIAALACWTLYGVVNASWLKAHSNINATAWTIAQGISIFPIVLLLAVCLSLSSIEPSGEWSKFLLVSLVVGLGSSWLATLCWTHASRTLPMTIAGQIIVVETIAAVLYGLLYQSRAPSLALAAGIVLLCVGVVLGIRAFQVHATTRAS